MSTIQMGPNWGERERKNKQNWSEKSRRAQKVHKMENENTAQTPLSRTLCLIRQPSAWRLCVRSATRFRVCDVRVFAVRCLPLLFTWNVIY